MSCNRNYEIFFISMNGEWLETFDQRDAVITFTHALLYYHFYYNNHAQLELCNEQKHGPLSYLQHWSTNLITVNIYVCYLHIGTLTCCLNICHAVQLFQDIKHHVRQKRLVNLATFYSTVGYSYNAICYSFRKFHANVLN
jgi:hypothetical protein